MVALIVTLSKISQVMQYLCNLCYNTTKLSHMINNIIIAHIKINIQYKTHLHFVFSSCFQVAIMLLPFRPSLCFFVFEIMLVLPLLSILNIMKKKHEKRSDDYRYSLGNRSQINVLYIYKKIFKILLNYVCQSQRWRGGEGATNIQLQKKIRPYNSL